ncbi:MAG: ATP-binding protein [Treponema sp.]|nr:ATP-binding protein [Treponema sp.]
MEMILLVGLPGSGKSTYYKEHFFNTHLRISNDLLRTKNRSARLLDFCFETKMSFVVDNTNTTKEVRNRFIQACDVTALKQNEPIKKICYFFNCDSKICLERNEKRTGKDRVPKQAIFFKAREFEVPSLEEGFDELNIVDLNGKIISTEYWSVEK